MSLEDSENIIEWMDEYDLDQELDEKDAAIQSGGKMIGDGVYGCVFMPEFKCVPHTKVSVKGVSSSSSESHVSKLIDSESASIEFRLSKHISQIPLWRNYFVVSESMCDPSPRQTDPDLKKCEPLQKNEISQFKLLSMPYRGDSLHLHRFPIPNFDFMRFAKHMMEAGALMNLFHIVHRDLHQGNVLVDTYHVPRIIDFNLSIDARQKVTSGALSHLFEPRIAHEPPDSTFVNALYQHKEYKQDYDFVIRQIIEKKNVFKRIRSLLGTSKEEMRHELEEFYQKSKSAKTGDTVSWFRIYWSKIDSWAIGIILVDLITQFMNHSVFASKYATIKPVLEPILRDMCQVNPMKRIDCVQALARLDPSHFILRKYAASWLKQVQ